MSDRLKKIELLQSWVCDHDEHNSVWTGWGIQPCRRTEKHPWHVHNPEHAIYGPYCCQGKERERPDLI